MSGFVGGTYAYNETSLELPPSPNDLHVRQNGPD